MPGLVLPIIVLNLIGAKSDAYFYVAWIISNILTMIPGAVASSLLAEGAHDELVLKDHILRSFKILAVLLVPTIVLVWFLAAKLLLLYGSLYAENATILLRFLTIAAFPGAINVIYFSIKRIQKNVKPIILLAALMAFITVLTSYLLLPLLGIEAVGIAWLAAQSVIFIIVVVWDMKRYIFGMN